MRTDKKMRILFDMNHPADVHQFKHAIRMLSSKHHVLIIARDKECTLELLQEYGISAVVRKGYKGLAGKAAGMILTDIKLLRVASVFKPDILVGSSGDVYVAQAGWLLRKPSVIFDDTEHSDLQNLLCFPFATKIVTPASYKLDLGSKQVRYAGSKELAYLDPRYFKPRKTPKLNILRLVSWEASHDVGIKGMDAEKLFAEMSRLGETKISSERPLSGPLAAHQLRIKPSELHDYLANAKLVISEGGTMAVEAAVLGTPTIYCNPLSMGYSDELIAQGRMAHSVDQEIIISLARELHGKRNAHLMPKIDINKMIVREILMSGRSR